jgi:plastocyanin
MLATNSGRRYGGAWRQLFAASCLVLLAASPALPQDVATVANTATVTIDNFSFSPETLTIKPGTTVTFVNHDDIPHSIVAVDKAFRSRALDTDDSYEFTFTTAGDFDYFCGLHPHMKAKIVVTP